MLPHNNAHPNEKGQWRGIRVEVGVVNFPAGQPVSQRRSQRWRHLQLQHTTQLPIYAEHLSFGYLLMIVPAVLLKVGVRPKQVVALGAHEGRILIKNECTLSDLKKNSLVITSLSYSSMLSSKI